MTCTVWTLYLYEALRFLLQNPEVLHRYFNTILGSFGTRDFSFCKGVYFGKAHVFLQQLISGGASFTHGRVLLGSQHGLLGWKSALGADRLSSHCYGSTAEQPCSGASGPVFTSHSTDDTPPAWVMAPTWICQMTRCRTPWPHPANPSRWESGRLRLMHSHTVRILSSFFDLSAGMKRELVTPKEVSCCVQCT